MWLIDPAAASPAFQRSIFCAETASRLPPVSSRSSSALPLVKRLFDDRRRVFVATDFDEDRASGLGGRRWNIAQASSQSQGWTLGPTSRLAEKFVRLRIDSI